MKKIGGEKSISNSVLCHWIFVSSLLQNAWLDAFQQISERTHNDREIINAMGHFLFGTLIFFDLILRGSLRFLLFPPKPRICYVSNIPSRSTLQFLSVKAWRKSFYTFVRSVSPPWDMTVVLSGKLGVKCVNTKLNLKFDNLKQWKRGHPMFV